MHVNKPLTLIVYVCSQQRHLTLLPSHTFTQPLLLTGALARLFVRAVASTARTAPLIFRRRTSGSAWRTPFASSSARFSCTMHKRQSSAKLLCEHRRIRMQQHEHRLNYRWHCRHQQLGRAGHLCFCTEFFGRQVRIHHYVSILPSAPDFAQVVTLCALPCARNQTNKSYAWQPSA